MEQNKSHKSDEWWIDKKLFDKLCYNFGISPIYDYAANELNRLCENYVSKDENALKMEWIEDGWCNPPLSLCKEFIVHGYRQWLRWNINLMMPVPAGVISRKYFLKIWLIFRCNLGVEIWPIDRPKFKNEGKDSGSARNDYICLVFRKRNV